MKGASLKNIYNAKHSEQNVLIQSSLCAIRTFGTLPTFVRKGGGRTNKSNADVSSESFKPNQT